MRIGIVACNALKDEIEEFVARDSEVVHKEYLEFGLHTRPDEMRKKIIETVDALQGKVDVVLIGYATCQSLTGLTKAVKVPSVMIEAVDCIEALLSPEVYAKEKRGEGMITWFYPSGWAREGEDGITKLFHLDCMRSEGYEPIFFLKMMFDGFSRCVFIDSGAGDSVSCERISRDFASELNLKHESRAGTLSSIHDAYQKTRELGRELERRG